MFKTRFIAILLILAGVFVGQYVYTKQISNPEHAGGLFKLGLDLSGGIYLEYLVDVTSLNPSEIPDAMEALRDLIERRINDSAESGVSGAFGVLEPVVQIKNPGLFGLGDGTQEQRLTVQIPGEEDVQKAKDIIDELPVLEFREHRSQEELEEIISAQQEIQDAVANEIEDFEPNPIAFEPIHKIGDLTGRNLKRASMQFQQQTGYPAGEPVVQLEFDAEGAKMFAQLTKENAGGTIPIYVDGELISEPTVSMKFAQSGITGGTAIISGNFTVESAKDLAWRLNAGALPVDKMTLLESRTIGATLGDVAFDAGVKAATIGLILVSIFLVLWYRLPGLIAVGSLAIYLVLVLAFFKLIPVTLTAAGIAGFILSIGMAVDANILIFERMKEELRGGRTLHDAIGEGFARAWPSIRDGNLSSIITAVILFWFGTSLVEGFAFTFGIGILLSMFSAITLTRTFLFAIAPSDSDGIIRKLFGSGIS
jgi:preprotein translocase subunit SecD